MEEITIEPLSDHPRGAFCCALEKINNFFKNNALKSHENYAQRIFIARTAKDNTPLGFYALTTMTFRPGMNTEADQKFGRFEAIPTVYLTMIGRDNAAPKGIGEQLLLDAFKRALEVRENVGVYALTLHAYNEAVQSIYERFGFQVFSDKSQDQENYKAMFIPLSTVAASFVEAEAEVETGVG